ncbi:MAG: hypothetical protein NC930_03785, partial [Candidatus Omnitrophica bacterium]|nr:hypothetical protein [Candidatus Omnitrophota bacterium]
MDYPGYVWIVSSDHWLRACLRAELLERGLEVIGYQELAQALPEEGVPGLISPDAISLDLGSLEPKPEELKALAAMGAPVVVLMARVMREPEWPSCWRP